MVVNAHHYRRLTVKQSFDIENMLMGGGNVIDFPAKPHNLSRYDEELYSEIMMERIRETLASL